MSSINKPTTITGVPAKCWMFAIAGIILAVLVVVFVADGARKKELALNGQIEEVTNANKSLEEKKKLAENAASQMTTKIAALEGKINTLSREVEQRKVINDKTVVILRKKNLDVDNFKTKLDEAKAKERELNKQLEGVKKDYASAKELTETTAKKNKELEKKIKDLTENQATTLGTIIVRQASK